MIRGYCWTCGNMLAFCHWPANDMPELCRKCAEQLSKQRYETLATTSWLNVPVHTQPCTGYPELAAENIAAWTVEAYLKEPLL